MEVKLNIIKATVLSGQGTDKLILELDLPSTIPCFPTDPCTMKLDLTKGYGVEYCKEHFGIEPIVLSI